MDELTPDLRNLKATMDRLSIVTDEFEGKVTVEKW